MTNILIFLLLCLIGICIGMFIYTLIKKKIGIKKEKEILVLAIIALVISIGAATIFTKILRDITYAECKVSTSKSDIEISEEDKIYVSLGDFYKNKKLAHVIILRDKERLNQNINTIDNDLIYMVMPGDNFQITIKEYFQIFLQRNSIKE